PGAPTSLPDPRLVPQQPAGPPSPSGAADQKSDTQPVKYDEPSKDAKEPAKKSGWLSSLFSKKSSDK
ncbi:MAG TPA: hypothetical protein VKD72_13230, partial [Gemmataceae bacterium]|nr:hypothetical protein [Gemmataceae bacterium]